METVFVSPNPTQERCMHALPAILDTLKRLGFTVLLSDACPAVEGIESVSEEQGAEQSECIITIGGDSAVLRRAGLASRFNKPLLGINLGSIGYLTELDPGELDKLALLREDRYTLDQRTALDVSVVNELQEVTFEAFALNDAVVQRVDLSKTVPLAVFSDGAQVLDFRGDGAMVSTPTGSTAYSLAAGGPILEPGCDCLSVTPICPHSLWIKSFVVPGERCICITPMKWKVPIHLSVDGYQNHNLVEGERVQVCRSASTVPLIRLNGLGFYQRIAKKLS